MRYREIRAVFVYTVLFFVMKIAKKDARRFDVNNYVIIMVHVT